MYPDSVSRVHFLFVLIYGKSGFFIKFVKTYSISIKMGEHICFRRNERLATVNPEVGSEGLLSSFAGCRSGRFVDMAGA